MLNAWKNNGELKLSQCMIVKNEEKNIKEALSKAKDIVFEQIVVDTGSTDRTVEIAKEMGATIHHFPWIDDFAAAKNYAIEQAKGNWILFLDADEYLDEDGKRNLVKLLNYLKENRGQSEEVEVIRAEIRNIDKDGSLISSHYQDRIFRNKPSLRYVGAIHESLSCMEDRDFVFYYASEIKIWHTGYQQNLKKQKGERNTLILEKLIGENSESYDLSYYLADSKALLGEVQEACELYMNCIKHYDRLESRSIRYDVYVSLLKLLFSEEGLITSELENVIEDFAERYPDSPDPYFFMGVYAYEKEEFVVCIDNMKKASEMLKSFQDEEWFVSVFVREDLIHNYSGCAYFALNQYEEALSAFILYQKNNKDDEDSLLKILFILKCQPVSQEELTCFAIQILSGLYRLDNLKDVLICIKAAVKLNLEMLSEQLKKGLSLEDRKWFES